MTRLKMILSLCLFFSLAVVFAQAHNHGKSKMGNSLITNIDSSTKVTYASLIKLRHDHTQYWYF